MQTLSWILISIAILLIILLIIGVIINRKENIIPDYHTFFWIGLLWIAIGLPLGSKPIWIIGLIFMIIGLAHQEQWKKQKVKGHELSKKQKEFKKLVIINLTILLLISIALYFLAKEGLV